MDGQDDRFASAGGAQPAPPGEGYGFYGGAPTPQGSQFGAGPAPAPVGQFGSPPAAYGQAPAFGTPYAAPQAPTTYSQPSNKRKLIVAAVVGVVAIGAAGFAWDQYQLHQPVQVPTTLGTLPTLHTPELDTAVAQSQQEWENSNPGHQMKAGVYGNVLAKDVVILIAARGQLNSIEKDFASGGATSPLQKVGKNSCASLPSGTVCERTSRHLTEAIVSISKTRTVAQTSALLDEAWSKA